MHVDTHVLTLNNQQRLIYSKTQPKQNPISISRYWNPGLIEIFYIRSYLNFLYIKKHLIPWNNILCHSSFFTIKRDILFALDTVNKISLSALGLCSYHNGISTFMAYLMLKPACEVVCWIMLLRLFMVDHYWKVNDRDKRKFKTKQYKQK